MTQDIESLLEPIKTAIALGLEAPSFAGAKIYYIADSKYSADPLLIRPHIYADRETAEEVIIKEEVKDLFQLWYRKLFPADGFVPTNEQQEEIFLQLNRFTEFFFSDTKGLSRYDYLVTNLRLGDPIFETKIL